MFKVVKTLLSLHVIVLMFVWGYAEFSVFRKLV